MDRCRRTPWWWPAWRRTRRNPGAAWRDACSLPSPWPWNSRPSHEPDSNWRRTGKSWASRLVVPATTPSTTTAIGMWKREGDVSARHRQNHCIELRSSNGDSPSVHGIANGMKSGSWMPFTASCANWTANESSTYRSSMRGVTTRRSNSGQTGCVTRQFLLHEHVAASGIPVGRTQVESPGPCSGGTAHQRISASVGQYAAAAARPWARSASGIVSDLVDLLGGEPGQLAELRGPADRASRAPRRGRRRS